MSGDAYDPGTGGAKMDFKDAMSYGDDLNLAPVLSAQAPQSAAHDELLFIIPHQTSELWMELILHELGASREALGTNDTTTMFKMLARFSRIFEQLNNQWDVLRTMTPADYTTFRAALGPSSGFQSYQYRMIEYALGNRSPNMLKPHAHMPDVGAMLEAELAQPSFYDEVALASPRNAAERCSQVSFAFEHGYEAMQALIDRGVIGDFRAPDIMRFGFTPLYIDKADVVGAAEILEDVVRGALWRDPEFQTKSKVT